VADPRRVACAGFAGVSGQHHPIVDVDVEICTLNTIPAVGGALCPAYLEASIPVN
jgi:hypothetical protein